MKKIFLIVIMYTVLLSIPSGLRGNLQFLREYNVNRVYSLNYIVFSEVLYDSWVSGEDQGEWLELYNPTGSFVDIGGRTINDNNYGYTIPNGTGIGAGGFLIISSRKRGKRGQSTVTHLPNLPNPTFRHSIIPINCERSELSSISKWQNL